jgi:RNA polymerase-associated protein
MTLFSDSSCPYCHRVRIVLAEKKMTVDVVEVNASALPEEVRDANPYGTVPTLVDRDLRLYESRIIMEYLDERFPHPPLMPIDPVARANTRILMYRVDRDWSHLIDRIAKGSTAEAKDARRKLRDSLVATSPVFGAHTFFMSEEFSLVDCCIAPLMWRLSSLGIELPAAATAAKDYARRLFAWPSFRESLTQIEREMAPGSC